jgi:hypothetical protein
MENMIQENDQVDDSQAWLDQMIGTSDGGSKTGSDPQRWLDEVISGHAGMQGEQEKPQNESDALSVETIAQFLWGTLRERFRSLSDIELEVNQGDRILSQPEDEQAFADVRKSMSYGKLSELSRVIAEELLEHYYEGSSTFNPCILAETEMNGHTYQLPIVLCSDGRYRVFDFSAIFEPPVPKFYTLNIRLTSSDTPDQVNPDSIVDTMNKQFDQPGIWKYSSD